MAGTRRGSAASSWLGLGRTWLCHLPDPARGPESRGADPWPGESYGAGQTGRHHTQTDAHCYRHGGGERYFPMESRVLWVSGMGPALPAGRTKVLHADFGARREGPGSVPRRPPQHGCSCIRAAQAPSGSPSEGRHHLDSRPQGARHPGNVKGKERGPRPAAAGTRPCPASGAPLPGSPSLWGASAELNCVP